MTTIASRISNSSSIISEDSSVCYANDEVRKTYLTEQRLNESVRLKKNFSS